MRFFKDLSELHAFSSWLTGWHAVCDQGEAYVVLCSEKCVHMQGAYQVDNILKHGVNNIFILLDVFLSKQPFVSYHFQVRSRSVRKLAKLLLARHITHSYSMVSYTLSKLQRA